MSFKWHNNGHNNGHQSWGAVVSANAIPSHFTTATASTIASHIKPTTAIATANGGFQPGTTAMYNCKWWVSARHNCKCSCNCSTIVIHYGNCKHKWRFKDWHNCKHNWKLWFKAATTATGHFRPATTASTTANNGLRQPQLQLRSQLHTTAWNCHL